MRSWFAEAIIAGIASFVATNIDDIVILMLFFAQLDGIRPRHIIAGQYLGFTALIAASLPGYFGSLIVPRTWIGLLGLVPIIIGVSNLVNREENVEQVQVVPCVISSKANRSVLSPLTSLMNLQTYKVAAVTFANGGDNIGIYVPLFASRDLASLGVILGVFFLLVGVWCYIAYLLSRQPTIARFLTRYGQAFVPFVLIGLGIYILIESGTYQLLPFR